MTDRVKEIVALALQNKKTTIFGVLGVALWGAGDGLIDAQLEIPGAIVKGVGGVLLGCAWFFTRDAKPPGAA